MAGGLGFDFSFPGLKAGGVILLSGWIVLTRGTLPGDNCQGDYSRTFNAFMGIS